MTHIHLLFNLIYWSCLKSIQIFAGQVLIYFAPFCDIYSRGIGRQLPGILWHHSISQIFNEIKIDIVDFQGKSNIYVLLTLKLHFLNWSKFKQLNCITKTMKYVNLILYVTYYELNLILPEACTRILCGGKEEIYFEVILHL